MIYQLHNWKESSILAEHKWDNEANSMDIWSAEYLLDTEYGYALPRYEYCRWVGVGYVELCVRGNICMYGVTDNKIFNIDLRGSRGTTMQIQNQNKKFKTVRRWLFSRYTPYQPKPSKDSFNRCFVFCVLFLDRFRLMSTIERWYWCKYLLDALGEFQRYASSRCEPSPVDQGQFTNNRGKSEKEIT